jgi:hypothetical protein
MIDRLNQYFVSCMGLSASDATVWLILYTATNHRLTPLLDASKMAIYLLVRLIKGVTRNSFRKSRKRRSRKLLGLTV